MGILEENEYLLAKVRIYLEDRFNLMEMPLMLNYLELLTELGMF